MTSIQQAIIPVMINGKDSIAFSRTGTGKTLSYILPLLHSHYLNHSDCFITIIIPTTELGVQVYQTYNCIGKYKNISALFLNKIFKIKFLQKNKGICIVSTINFLIKNLKNFNNISACKRATLTIDEMELSISIQNIVLLKEVVLKLKPIQLNLFGVTDTTVFKFTNYFLYQKNVFLFNEKTTLFNFFSEVKHEYIHCSSKLKFKFLLILLKFKEKNQFFARKKYPLLIFLKNYQRLEKLVYILKKSKILFNYFHCKMNFSQRTLSIQIAKKSTVDVILCTDIGSRGLNFSFIDTIINLDMPVKIETYIHRIGRIGRFKKKGYCLNIIDKNEANFIDYFQKNVGISMNKSNSWINI
jgi:superfamily II DNA/RNA helicase